MSSPDVSFTVIFTSSAFILSKFTLIWRLKLSFIFFLSTQIPLWYNSTFKSFAVNPKYGASWNEYRGYVRSVSAVICTNEISTQLSVPSAVSVTNFVNDAQITKSAYLKLDGKPNTSWESTQANPMKIGDVTVTIS